MLFVKDLDMSLQDRLEGLILEGRATGYSIGSWDRIVLVLLHVLVFSKSLGLPFSVVRGTLYSRSVTIVFALKHLTLSLHGKGRW